MANEAEIISNPTSVPTAVSESYARQNTRAYAATNGIDYTYMALTGELQATLYQSGPVDVNGTLYSINSQVNFAIPNTGQYYVHLVGTGNNLTPTLSTDAGSWVASKNARYNSSGERVLNWVISRGGITTALGSYVDRLMEPALGRNSFAGADMPQKWTMTGTAAWVAPRSKYYDIEIQAAGGRGGYVSNSTGTGRSGSGGGGGYMRHRIYIAEGTTWTSNFTLNSGANITFSDGVTTLYAQNGYWGQSKTRNGTCNAKSGDGGGFYPSANFGVAGKRGVTGGHEYDIAAGAYTNIISDDSVGAGAGGDSFMGFGANYKNCNNYAGGIAICTGVSGFGYGGGGSGTRCADGYTSMTQSDGGAAIIIITG